MTGKLPACPEAALMSYDRLDASESLPVLNRRPSAALLLPSLFLLLACGLALPVVLAAAKAHKPGTVPPAAIVLGILGVAGVVAFFHGVQVWLSNRCQLTPRRLFVTH